MRYFVRLLGAISCALGLWAAALTVQAGPREDCQYTWNTNDVRIRACSDIIRRDKKAAWAYSNRAAAYLAKGEYDRAIADYSEVIRLKPSDAAAHASRGNAYNAKGEYDRAIADHDEAIRLNPSLVPAYSGRSIAFANKGDADRAIADLNEAIRLDPRKADRDRDIAKRTEAIKRNPSDADAHLIRAYNYMIEGEYDRAIADFGEAIRLKPSYADAHTGRGAAYYAKGDYDGAIAVANEAIKLNPSGPGTTRVPAGRAYAYASKGEYDRAIADLNELIRPDPRDFVLYSIRGKAYHGKGDYDRAMADHDEAIRLGPDSGPDSLLKSRSYFYRGMTHEARGDRDKAAEDYNKALTIPPTEIKWDRDLRADVTRRLATLRRPAPAPAAPAEKEVAAAKPAAPNVAPAVPAPPPPAAALGRRVALVIGNAGYRIGPLQNPGNDAEAVAAALRDGLKFDKVVLKRDLASDGFRAALREFGREASGADLALVYFAGHGTEVAGRNFLIPVDVALAKAADLDLEAIALDTVLGQLEGVRKLRLVILDACRNNLFPLAGAQRSVTRGLSRFEPEDNTLVVYAAKHGTTADDGTGRRHSPFTEAFLKRVATPALEIRQLFGYVRDDVMAVTRRVQQPHIYGTLGGPSLYLQ